jgi:hypothetical protein
MLLGPLLLRSDKKEIEDDKDEYQRKKSEQSTALSLAALRVRPHRICQSGKHLIPPQEKYGFIIYLLHNIFIKLGKASAAFSKGSPFPCFSVKINDTEFRKRRIKIQGTDLSVSILSRDMYNSGASVREGEQEG